MRCPNDQGFRLVSTELQTVLCVLQSDIGSARNEHCQSVGCIVSAHGKIELRVVSILVVLYAKLSCSTTGLEQTANRICPSTNPLRDADVKAHCW